jgi:hypothetical protein
MLGGEKLILDGGFPPIYEILEKSTDESKKREYMKDNSVMSVHNILTDRKQMPFLPMRIKTNLDGVEIDYNSLNLNRTKKSSKKGSKKGSKKSSKKANKKK